VREMRGLRRGVWRIVFGCCALSAFAFSWCWSGGQITRQTPAMEGGKVPQRIVTMSPSLTALVIELGLGERLVGVGSYCELPPALASLPRLGGWSDPNVEALVALGPDLVLLQGEHQRLQGGLSRLGLRTLQVSGDTYTEVLNSFVVVADACGVRAAGEALRARIRAEVDAAAAQVRGACRAGLRVLLVVGRRPDSLQGLLVAGGESFLGVMLAKMALANVAPGGEPWPTVSREVLLAADPELVVDVIYGAGGPEVIAREVQRWQSEYGALTAVAQGRLRVIHAPSLSVPGPKMGESAAMLAFHLAALCEGGVGEESE